MTGFFLVFPLRAPVVVRMITGSPPSSPPSAPPVASYLATCSRTRSLGLGTYSAPLSAPADPLSRGWGAASADSAPVLSFMAGPPALRWTGRMADEWSAGGAAAVGGDDRTSDVGGLR